MPNKLSGERYLSRKEALANGAENLTPMTIEEYAILSFANSEPASIRAFNRKEAFTYDAMGLDWHADYDGIPKSGTGSEVQK